MRNSPAVVFLATVSTLSIAVMAQAPPPPVKPTLETAAVSDDADDPAVWINAKDPSRSLIVGTNKVAAPGGALYAFGLDGQVRQRIGPLDRPNNVDVEYGLEAGQTRLDIAVTTERLESRLRVHAVTEAGLRDVSGPEGIPVLAGEQGEGAMPMGIALYKRPRDGAIFAIVAPKTGGRDRYLWQYRLTASANGIVSGALVRRFGNYSGTSEIEAVAVDDELGYVYFADEDYGIRKWHADPDHPDANRELAVFGSSGFEMNREGIGIYPDVNGGGYIVCVDQIPGGSRLRFYPRRGLEGRPHDQDRLLHVVRIAADSTDGMEVVRAGALPGFPHGAVIAMNSSGKNFHVYRWEDVRPGSPQVGTDGRHVR